MPARYTGAPEFRAACLAAGLVLGCANWLLVRRVIGSRLRALADRLSDIAATVGNPVASAQGSSRPAADLALPVGSRDDLGTTAAAFNALLAALDHTRRFRSVVHATNDVLALLTPTGELSFVSDPVADVLGWTREELLGRHPGELLHADDADLFTDSGAPIAPDGHALSQVFLVQARHRDGSWRHLEVSSSDRRGGPAGRCGNGRSPTSSSGRARTCCPTWTPSPRSGWPRRYAAPRSPRPRSSPCSTGWGWPGVPTTTPHSCPAGSSSAWRWPAASSAPRRGSSPTSPPRSWTPRPPSGCSS